MIFFVKRNLFKNYRISGYCYSNKSIEIPKIAWNLSYLSFINLIINQINIFGAIGYQIVYSFN